MKAKMKRRRMLHKLGKDQEDIVQVVVLGTCNQALKLGQGGVR